MADLKYEDWVPVFRSGTDYEADIVRDRLDDSGVPAVVLTQRDHAFNLNVSDLAAVNVMVPPNKVDEALSILNSEPFSDDELNEAAQKADPNAPPAHSGLEESALDSGANIGGPVQEGEEEQDEETKDSE